VGARLHFIPYDGKGLLTAHSQHWALIGDCPTAESRLHHEAAGPRPPVQCGHARGSAGMRRAGANPCRWSIMMNKKKCCAAATCPGTSWSTIPFRCGGWTQLPGAPAVLRLRPRRDGFSGRSDIFAERPAVVGGIPTTAAPRPRRHLLAPAAPPCTGAARSHDGLIGLYANAHREPGS
jgi:hypothetical protein